MDSNTQMQGTTLKKRMMIAAAVLAAVLAGEKQGWAAETLEKDFTNPPDAAKPGVMWMWMGRNITRQSITRDLEALHEAGYGRTLTFSLADTTTPWPGEIGNSPHPEAIAWTEPWWKLVRHAAEESKRLKMDFGMFNGPGYSTSGGPWVKVEHSMQQLCFSQTPLSGPRKFKLDLPRPTVDPRAVQPFPVFNPNTGKVEKPEIPERRTFYRDIAVIALPADGVAAKDQVFDLTGRSEWDAPAGEWTVYRFGHTTMGNLLQPSQWEANRFECDKISVEAVTFHMNHVIGEIKRHLETWSATDFLSYNWTVTKLARRHGHPGCGKSSPAAAGTT